jgi:FixJ family two-component response regulator
VASDDDNHSFSALHSRAAREVIVSKSALSQSRLAGVEEPIVYVVDDDVVMREALSSLFRSVDLQVRVFSSAPELLQGSLADKPSCLVLDIRLPGVSGLEFQAELATAGIHIPIIFMTGHGDITMTVKAMKAGAVDFLEKPFRHQEMLDAVALAIERDRKRRANQKTLLELQGRLETLTPREREVIGFVTAGMMNKQVAGEMGVTEMTVKIHRGHLMRKMGARSLADLVMMAEALGIRRERSAR